MPLCETKQTQPDNFILLGCLWTSLAVAGKVCHIALQLDLAMAITAAHFHEIRVELAARDVVQFQTLNRGLSAVDANRSKPAKAIYLPRLAPCSADWLLLSHYNPPFVDRYSENSDRAGSIEARTSPEVTSSTPATVLPRQGASALRLPRRYRPRSRK